MSESAGPGRPRVVYLDMNIWIAMARGRHTQDRRWLAAIESVLAAVASNRLVIPLSSSHYLELWNRSDAESRERVAAMMRDLSDYASIAPIQDIRRAEIDAVVARHVRGINDNHTRQVSADDLLGHGANHAFSSSNGRFRFVQSLASPDGEVAEGPPMDPPDNWNDSERVGPAWEWLNLNGRDDVVHAVGLERTPTHRLGDAYMQDELRLRELIQREPWAKARLEDLVITDEIMSLTDTINLSCFISRLDPHVLFLENPDHPDPPSAMRAFVRSLPSVDTAVRLRSRKHRDLSHPWDQHDRVDIISLATAVPYCDVLLTEKRWAHMVNDSKLAADYNLQVGYGLAAVEDLATL